MKWCLTILVALFPAEFKLRFGPDLHHHLRADYDRFALRGHLPRLRFSFLTALDLVAAALAERCRPSWKSARGHAADTGSLDMTNITLSHWIKDFRYAGRALRHSPGFTVIAVATLALALGANAGIFSIVDSVLLSPLPFAHQDRLVYIAASAPGSDFPEEFGVAREFYFHYRDHATLLEDVSAFNSFTSTLRVDDRTERVRMSFPTPELFSTLGASPILGRLPVPEDEDQVAVISHQLWVTWFGADPEVLGRSYYISGRNRTIVGVMGPDFWFPNDQTVLWGGGPLSEDEVVPGRFGIPLIARLAPGATPEDAAAELAQLASQLPERYGGDAAYARLIQQHRPIVRPLATELLGDVAGPLWVLLGAVGIVLLIACANVASLFMVRAESRQRDLAIRRAIGASRGQLVRSLLAEAAIVAALAGALAIAIAWLTVPLFLRAAPASTPRLGEVGIATPTLLFTLAAALVSALLCGLAPALRASNPSFGRLREGPRGATRRHTWGRDGLVVVQTALALLLLIGSGLLVRSFERLRKVDPGYDTQDILTFQVAPEGAHLTDAGTYARFHLDFMDRIAALPGVESVGVVENVPLNEDVTADRFRTEETASLAESGTLLSYTWAGGDYFETMGIDLKRGRVFEQADLASPGSAIVSQAAADLLWPGQDPMGRRLRFAESDTWETVVGLVEDVLQNDFRDQPEPLVYLPLVGQTPQRWVVSSPAYVVKTRHADEIAAEVRALLREVAPNAPMYRVFTMAGLAADSMVQLSFTMLTLGIASLLALILGLIGLYGVLSYVVAERTREIGVRMALGAQARRVQLMVVAQGARVVTLGVAIGLVVAIAATRLLGGLLFGVEAVDGPTFVGMSATMVVMGLLACYLPARRASRVDPIRSLRLD